MSEILRLTEKKIKSYLLEDNSSFISAIKTINKNKYKFLIVVDKHNKVIGTLTDGDIRRAYLKFTNLEKLKLKNIIINKFIKILYDESDFKIENLLNKHKITYIPLVNDANIIKAQERIEKILGLKVNILNKKNNSGKITIEYKNLDQFELISDLLIKH